jgi:chaperonin GroES
MSTKSEVKIRPLSDRVVMEREESEAVLGGIILPDAAKEKQEIARIVAVGPGKTDEKGVTHALEVKVGDRVLIEKYSAQEVVVDGTDYIIARASEILAIVE